MATVEAVECEETSQARLDLTKLSATELTELIGKPAVVNPATTRSSS